MTNQDELAQYLHQRGYDHLIGAHIEYKRSERISMHDALKHASSNAGSNVPIVAHQRDQKWIAVLNLDDLLMMLQSGAAHIVAIQQGKHQ